MNQAPKIGERVRYPGGLCVGPCTGTVMAIYQTTKWINETTPSDKLAPESEWRIGVKVDAIPELWAYAGSDRFAPSASELRRYA